MNIDSPCHECEFRHPACHDECVVYAEYKAALEEANERRKDDMTALRAKDKMLSGKWQHKPKKGGLI